MGDLGVNSVADMELLNMDGIFSGEVLCGDGGTLSAKGAQIVFLFCITACLFEDGDRLEIFMVSAAISLAALDGLKIEGTFTGEGF